MSDRDKAMIFQVASTEAACICTAKVIGNYSPDVFDDMSSRVKRAFLEIVPQLLEGDEIAEVITSEDGVDIAEYGSELL